MDGLDLLKQHWNKDGDFPKVNKEEIRRMLYKSSSSLAKWIFFVSVIELFLGLAFNAWFFFFSDVEMGRDTDPLWLEIIDQSINVISYVITFYFIYTFFQAYYKIKNTNNTKDLLNDILASRKTVNQYISFNIYLIIISLTIGSISFIIEKHIFDKSTGEMMLYAIFTIIAVSIMGFFIIKLMKFYFRLIYIRLVNKLDKNYDELVQLED